MLGRIDQKYRQIFQIQIKEQRLSKILDSFNSKITFLTHNLQSLKQTFARDFKPQNLKNIVKEQIKQELQNISRRFFEKLQKNNKQLFRLQYSYQNFEKNNVKELQEIKGKYSLLEKSILFLNRHQINALKSDIQNLREKSTETKEVITGNLSKNMEDIQKLNIKSIAEEEKLSLISGIINNINAKIIEKPTNKYVNEKPNYYQSKSRPYNYRKSMAVQEKNDNHLRIFSQRIESLQAKLSAILKNTKSSHSIQNEANTHANKSPNQQSFLLFDKKISNSKKSRFVDRNSIKIHQNNQEEVFQSEEKIKGTSMCFINENKKLSQKVAELQFKYSVLQESYRIVLNKISKLGNLEKVVQSKIEEAEKLRVDLSTINEINMRFKKIQQAMQRQEVKYVSKVYFQKQLLPITEGIDEIEKNLIKLAGKEQIKNAFQFIQNKIKEIIIVLTDKFQNEKSGALNKIKLIRCLTCDKQAENSQNKNTPNFRESQTSHINQRVNSKKISKVMFKRVRTQEDQ